jgi:hypothetical protein
MEAPLENFAGYFWLSILSVFELVHFRVMKAKYPLLFTYVYVRYRLKIPLLSPGLSNKLETLCCCCG